MARRLRLALPLLTLLTWLSAAGAAEAPPKAVPKAPPASPPPAASAEIVDYDPELDPPPGPPADVALWKSGRDVSFDARRCREEASDLQRRVWAGKLTERLGAAAKGRSPEEAARLTEAQKRLYTAWTENFTIMSRPWPVDSIRGCAYQWLIFEGALRDAASGSKRNDLVAARADLRGCVDRLGAAVKQMERSNADLLKLAADAEKTLAAVEPPPVAPKGGAGKPAAPQAAAEPHREEAAEKQEHRRD